MSNYKQISEALLTSYHNLTFELYARLVDNVCQINMNNIEEELKNQAAFYSHYAGLLAEAKKDQSDLESSLECMRANKRILYTSLYIKNPQSGKPTDKNLEAAVNADGDILELCRKINEQERKYNLLRALVTGLDHKRDCLVQISSNNRAEAKIYAK